MIWLINMTAVTLVSLTPMHGANNTNTSCRMASENNQFIYLFIYLFFSQLGRACVAELGQRSTVPFALSGCSNQTAKQRKWREY